MSNSYRIRTQVGVDKSVRVKLEQDYEFLEILSLKFLQSEVYTRQCSDYGVVVGRVTVNDGFGVPNVKVSVFIPLSSQDENNPIISELYPYKSPTDLNEDGYKYNLLPYVKSYSAHVPTGSFFQKEDVLINPTYIEVFDKYYRFTARTNDSGDFMIFGVPIGTQTLHFDVDLSDIGEFSLSPQDLIRMGRATEAQVAGTSFRSSTNLNELPQIISINRKIEVEPLWGQEDLCVVGITRLDIDLTTEATINITPTAIFMGSIFSSADSQFQSRNCKPKTRQGELCSLVAGPGEILAIRQTIFEDINGRPFLEEYELEQGGQVIDENGTWLVDVPMNLDYVITNEFGERVLSDDPKKGIPTKGKYRFKIKWNQSPKLSETLKRGYFLVPNIKEYGWTDDLNDPLINPVSNLQNLYAKNSYSFSLDWNEYGFSGTTEGLDMIQEAIDCRDRFYLMSYNKVYTVSQLIDQFRAGYLPNRTISVKNILDESCESDNNKFPTNDAVLRFDLVFLLFTLMMLIFKPTLYVLLITVHVLAFVLMLIGPIIALIYSIIFGIFILLCRFVRGIGFRVNCPSGDDYRNTIDKILNLYKLFTNLPLPNLTYPDCELCDCNDPQLLPASDQSEITEETTGNNLNNAIEEANLNAYLSPYTTSVLYSGITNDDSDLANNLQQLMSGLGIPDTPNELTPVPNSFVFDGKVYGTSSLTLGERLNLFNVKAKYFDNVITDPINNPQGNNPGGGYNRIRTSFRPTQNVNKFHYDNVLAISCLPSKLSELVPGQIVSFQDPLLSGDPNLTGNTSLNVYGTSSITGTTINNGLSTITIQFAHPNGSGTYTATTYNITQGTNDVEYAKFPIDIEYFQVITAMTYSQFVTQCNNSDPLTFNSRYLSNSMRFYRIFNSNGTNDSNYFQTPITNFNDYRNQVICFLVRGVDPYSTKGEVKYDLSKLFGKNWGQVVVTGNNYKLNIPIQGAYKPVRHNSLSSNLTNTTTLGKLYYDSYHFEPGDEFSGFTTSLPSYYSSLDLSTQTYRPITSRPTLGEVSEINSTFGVRVRIAPITTAPPTGPSITAYYQNGFSWEYDVYNLACVYYSPTANKSLTSNNNRGYFQGEIVDGGSYMFQGPWGSNLYWQPTLLPCGGARSPRFIGYYYSPKYNITFTYPTTLGSTGRQIVMRTDRLPTSTSLSSSLTNYFPLHTNDRFAVFLFSDDGVVSTSQSIGSNSASVGGDPGDNLDSTLALNNSVINTFQCANLIPLPCYESVNGEISVKPNTDPCYYVNNRDLMKNGCYILVSKIFLSLTTDFKTLTEWTARTRISFGACRNVWSHIFTNNWINGTLYAFAFKNERFFTSPFLNDINQTNQPFSVYCKNTLILHPTNNFYYRSSPFRIGVGFIGAPRLTPTFLGVNIENLFGSYRGNIRFLNFPTTMMDLGPRSQYIQELVMSDEFDGYVVNQLKGTTYTDVSDILNLLIISRLVNTSFIAQLFGTNGASINTYFNERDKKFVDGDYSQLISIASELGVSDFEPENYPPRPAPLQDPIYFNNATSSDAIIGIFFSSDTQVRDFISPRRTIINENLNIGLNCTFNSINVFTQRVPFYQWSVISNGGSTSDDNIFGSQKNDWYTNKIDQFSFFNYPYQLMDRANPASRYFRSNNSLTSINYKGYIYQENNGEYSIDVTTINLNTPLGRTITVGAPFHFYFGLKKGKTAWDRFATKWINFDIITD
jgi:hypothetical protein